MVIRVVEIFKTYKYGNHSFFLNLKSMLRKKSKQNHEDYLSLEKQYQNIMDCFDFLHVQQMMNWEKARVNYDDYLNHMSYSQWKIYINGAFKIPSIEELRHEASKLLKSAIDFAKRNPKTDFYSTGTGPFKVIYRYGILELSCDFESWSCD
jgi:hypothetical protein